MSDTLSYCEECGLKYVRYEEGKPIHKRVYRCPVCESDSVDWRGKPQNDDPRHNPDHGSDRVDHDDRRS